MNINGHHALCVSCDFWDQNGYRPTAGWCRRLSPTVVAVDQDGNEVSFVPTTAHDEWCGKFRPTDEHSESGKRAGLIATYLAAERAKECGR